MACRISYSSLAGTTELIIVMAVWHCVNVPGFSWEDWLPQVRRFASQVELVEVDAREGDSSGALILGIDSKLTACNGGSVIAGLGAELERDKSTFVRNSLVFFARL